MHELYLGHRGGESGLLRNRPRRRPRPRTRVLCRARRMSPEPAMGGIHAVTGPTPKLLRTRTITRAARLVPLPSYCTRAYAEYDAGFRTDNRSEL